MGEGVNERVINQKTSGDMNERPSRARSFISVMNNGNDRDQGEEEDEDEDEDEEKEHQERG